MLTKALVKQYALKQNDFINMELIEISEMKSLE